jgi:SHS2 domain-containing protein
MTATVTAIDHTADIGARVRADTPAEAFAAITEATIDFILDRSTVEPRETWTITLDADGWTDLLVAWLEEVLYTVEGEDRIPRSVTFTELDEEHLSALLSGERLDPDRHELKLQIKAVTYHQLVAQQTPNGFVAQVIFDI